MKKLCFIGSALCLFGLSSCTNYNGPLDPIAGTLSAIKADPSLLVGGQWVEFEVEELRATSPGYIRKDVCWTVNGFKVLNVIFTEN